MQRIRRWIKRYKRWAISFCLYGAVGFTMRQQGSIDLQWIAFAEEATETSNTASLIQNLNVILKIIYVIMWPLLVVAGLAMDNSLVLGEVFHLDKPLWQFRRIMTNFANFALGFMVIFYILKFVVGSKGDTKEVFDIIKKALIAGIGIQASRFLMLAALDISNIAIYSIGSIPTNVLDADAELGEKKVLRVHSTVDYAKFNTPGTEGDDDESFELFYSCGGGDQWQQCTFASGYMFNLTDAEYCVLGGMYARDSVMKLSGKDYVPIHNQDVGPAFVPQDVGYPTPLGPDWGELVTRADVQAPDDDLAGCQTLGDLIGGSKGFVGPLVTVYSSILDFASINLTDTQKTTGGVMIVFLLKTIIALALLIPMILLCGVLIVRVGYLWFYLAFMPIYVIKRAFGLKFSILGNEDRDSISGLVGAIFMPVIVVFALSMSLVFLTLTTEVMSPADTQKSAEFWGNFDIEKVDSNEKTIYKLPPTGNELHFKKPDQFYGASMFRDFFAYIFVNLMAIGMMWLLYFAAMKSWKGMSKTVDGRQKQAQTMMQRLPVVPIPGGGKVGLGTAFNANPDDRRGLLGKSVAGVTNRMNKQERAAIDNMMANKDLNTSKERDSAAAEFTGTAGIGFNQAAQRAIRDQGDTASTSVNYLDTESIDKIAALGRENKDNARAIATQNVIKDLEVQSGLEDANKRLTQWSNNTEISGRLRDDIKKSAGGMKFLTIAGGTHVLHVLGDKLTLSEVGPGMFGDKGAEDIAAIVAAQPIAMANQIMAKMDDPDKILGGRKDKEGTGEETVYSISGSKYTWNSESKQFVPTGTAAAETPATGETKELHLQTSAEIQKSFEGDSVSSINTQITKSLEGLEGDDADELKKTFEAELSKTKIEVDDKEYERSSEDKKLVEPTPEPESEPSSETEPSGDEGTPTPPANE